MNIGLRAQRGLFRTGPGPFLIAMLFVFQFFQVDASREGFNLIWGPRHDNWSLLLAVALGVIDFYAVALEMMGVAQNLGREARLFLFGAWVLSAFGDTALTWLVVATQQSQLVNGNAMVQAGLLSRSFFTTGVPVGFAVLTWAISMFLVSRIAGVRGYTGGGSATTNTSVSTLSSFNPAPKTRHYTPTRTHSDSWGDEED